MAEGYCLDDFFEFRRSRPGYFERMNFLPHQSVEAVALLQVFRKDDNEQSFYLDDAGYVALISYAE